MIIKYKIIYLIMTAFGLWLSSIASAETPGGDHGAGSSPISRRKHDEDEERKKQEEAAKKAAAEKKKADEEAQAKAAAKAAAAQAAADAARKRAAIVDRYLNLMPEMAAFINDVKSLAANYLDDNLSVSSIPRNYLSLNKKHLQWIVSYLEEVNQGKPDFASIVDLATYQAAKTKINAFSAKCQSDRQLADSERRFVSDLQVIGASIATLKDRAASLQARLNSGELRGIGDGALAGSFVSTADKLSDYAGKIETTRRWMMVQQAKRRLLCTEIPRLWEEAADAHLSQANVGEADSVIAAAEATLRGPRVYDLVVSSIENGRASIDWALKDVYAPLHARRALRTTKAKMAEVKAMLAQASISDDMRRAAGNAVAQFEKLLPSLEASVTAAIADQDQLGKERQRLIRLFLKHNKHELTSECASLSNSIVSDTAPGALEAEDRYIEFRANCRQ